MTNPNFGRRALIGGGVAAGLHGSRSTAGPAAMTPATASYAARPDLASAVGLMPGTTIWLAESGREGLFVIRAGVAPTDPLQGIYVPLAAGGYAQRVIGPARYALVDWFGAVANDMSRAAENVAAIQACLALCSKAMLDFGHYYTSATIVLNDDQELRGQGKTDEYHSDAAARANGSAIVVTSPTLDCVRLGKAMDFRQPGTPPAGWTQAATLRDLDVRRSVPVAPTAPNDEANGPAGVRCCWIKHATIRNVFSYDHAIGFYWGATVYCVDQENLCAFRATPGTNANDYWAGCFVDGAFALGSTYAGGNASLKIRSIKCGIAFGPARRSNNFLVTGGFADTWLYNAESYGVPKRACVIAGSVSSGATGGQKKGAGLRRQSDGDAHFIEPVFDGAGEVTLEIYGLTAYATIDFVDPYIAVTGSSTQSGVSVHDGAGCVTFHGGEILGWPNAQNGGTGFGIVATGARYSTSIEVLGTKMIGCIRPIVVRRSGHHRFAPVINNPNEYMRDGGGWVTNPFPAIDLVEGSTRCIVDAVIKADRDPATPGDYKAFLTGVRTDAGSVRNEVRLAGIDETIMSSGAPAILDGHRVGAYAGGNSNTAAPLS